MNRTYNNPTQLACDEDYINWVLTSDQLSDQIWQEKLRGNADLKKIESEARQLVLGLAHQESDLSQTEQDDILSGIHDRMHAPMIARRSVRLRYTWISVAAIGLFLVAAYFLLHQPGGYETDFGERDYITLSDGTGVFLNANSHIEVVGDWEDSGERRVHLLGEAYFDVTSSISQGGKPFVVDTDKGSVRVLGTEFNILSRADFFDVVLTEGAVNVSWDERDEEVQLLPGERFALADTEEGFIKDQVSVDIYTSWREGIIKCDKTPLIEVARMVEETYGIPLKFQNETLANRKLTGTLGNGDLDELLNAIEVIMDISVTRYPSYYLLSY